MPDHPLAPPIDGAIPLVLGVVGHRDIKPEQADLLTAALQREIESFREEYPHSPVIVLTSLAQGADLLAVKAAHAAGVRVRAPLPMPSADYRNCTSFDATPAGARALADFDNCLANQEAVEVYVVPMPNGPTLPAGGWAAVARGGAADEKNYRNFAYAAAGRYLVGHCHVLICLWDGQEADPLRPSGTAEHALLKLTGRRHLCLPTTAENALGFRGERGPVIVLHTPRLGKADPTGKRPGARALLVPITQARTGHESGPPAPAYHSLGDELLAARRTVGQRLWARIWAALGHRRHEESSRPEQLARAEVTQFQDICQTVEDFNRDISKLRAQQTWSEIAQKGDEAAAHFKDSQLKNWAKRIALVQEGAGEVSSSLDRWLTIAVALLFVSVGIAVLLLHLYAHPIALHGPQETSHEQHHLGFLAASLALWGLIFLAILWFWKHRIEERRLDARALAEALRVRLAWARAGIGLSVSAAYAGQLRSEMTWVRQALHHLCPPPQFWAEDFQQQTNQLERLRDLLGDWAIDQRTWFEKKHKEQHRGLLRYRRGGFLLALVGLFVWQLGMLIAHLLAWALDPKAFQPDNWQLVGSSMLVVLGGLLIGYCERRAFENLAQQYDRMKFLFDNACYELEASLAANDVAAAQRVCVALGREAVAEHASWLLLRRARPMELQLG